MFMSRELFLCMFVMLLPYSTSSGALGSPGRLLICSVITLALNISIILIITLQSFNP